MSPSEFNARRHWRAFRVEPRDSPRAIGAERLAVAGAVLAFHALLALWLTRALAPPVAFDAVDARVPEQVLIVRFPEPRPELPAELPEPPIPSRSATAPAPRDSRPERMPAPAPAALPTSAAEAPSEVSVARLRDALGADLRQQSMRERAAAPARGFGRPAGPALGGILDRPAELPGRRSRLDGMWAPDGESLAAEFVRRATVEREFKDRWGGRIRCVFSPVTLGLPVCAFGFAQEPLPDAPLAPNEAPRDGRRPLGSPPP